MVNKTKSDISRFHRNYIVTSCGCWIWLKSGQVKGSRAHMYGRMWIGSRTDKTRKGVIVTRWVWEHFFGKIPANHLICHKCDIPECVNPNHLWLGTHKENAQDMIKKGRAPDGITKLDGTKRFTHSGDNHPKRIKKLFNT